ncbi:MAG: hypothetical protein OXR68_05770 [Alphaproteobacteria bacterium]|nr:hypothetical protein [Alphaproteobacteria bacterium]MDD9920112.1 hypothetical protein [Alphaproteobacteria bacterium]
MNKAINLATMPFVCFRNSTQKVFDFFNKVGLFLTAVICAATIMSVAITVKVFSTEEPTAFTEICGTKKTMKNKKDCYMRLMMHISKNSR